MYFRPRRYYLIVGIVCAVFFAGIGVASTIAAYTNVDGSFARPTLCAFIFGGFWSGWTLLAGYLIAAYFRERLLLTEEIIVQRGTFRWRTISVADVVRIQWRTLPKGGSLVVRTHLQKIKINLDDFTKEKREEIMLFFREKFDAAIQENQLRFDHWARDETGSG